MRSGIITVALATLGCLSAIIAACTHDANPASEGQLDAAVDAPPCLTNDDKLPSGPCSAATTAACSVAQRGCIGRTEWLCMCDAGYPPVPGAGWWCFITGGAFDGCDFDAGTVGRDDAGLDAAEAGVTDAASDAG